jgi:hypothetical protein
MRHADRHYRHVIIGLVLISMTLGMASFAAGEGSGTIYRGAEPTGFRSHLEWRTSNYGGGDSPDFLLRRRTLLRVFVQQGETMLLGSSGIAVDGSSDNGDIRVLLPDQLLGPIGQELIPPLSGIADPPQPGAYANGFSCRAQRSATGEPRGRITSTAMEEAGPLPAVGGYLPCSYIAPSTGIYAVIFTGPAGPTSDAEPIVSGQLTSPDADFGPNQRTSVTAWDVTVRNAAGDQPGRVFAYYYAGTTGGGARPISGQGYVVTSSGFRYRVVFDGDPFGFLFYVNQRGFQNSDGTPLYRNVMADPDASIQDQNQLRVLQGGVRLLPPEYPIFISPPDPLTLAALGIPDTPRAPEIRDLRFRGPLNTSETRIGLGGTFDFVTTQTGIFYLVISRDGANFDPTAPHNRVLRGNAERTGLVQIAWDGRDNRGELFPVGEFVAATAVQGGEVHFPFLDVENNLRGGPVIQLLNPPDITGDGIGDCPPWVGGCFGAFYDDRGYVSANGTRVGTELNGPLCPGDADNPRGFGNPPLLLVSDPQLGFDTRTGQRAFGFPFDANPAQICLPRGGFGDKKGLDLWTYYPSNILQTPLQIVEPTAIQLRSFTVQASTRGALLSWATGSERNTQGFHILRSPSGALRDAVRITPTIIVAQGNASQGAVYRWHDTTATAATATYWLEEWESTGTTRSYGPALPLIAPTEQTYRLMFPLVWR